MRLWIAFRTSVRCHACLTGITLLAACKIMEPALDSPGCRPLLLMPVSFMYFFRL